MKGALESYFDTVRAELTFWSINDDLRRQLSALRDGWAQLPGDPKAGLQRGYIDENPYPPERRGELVAWEDGSAYAEAHRELHALARAFVVERGYYDFLLIDPLSPGGELLRVAPAYGFELVSFTIPIPSDVSLAGFTLCTQGGGAGGGAGMILHNAFDVRLGTVE